MVARILLIAGAACVLNLANGSDEPVVPFPGFHPCKLSDDACALDNTIKGVPAFADGIPSLDVERLDPLPFNKLDASSKNLKFILENIILTGLKTCKPLKVKRDIAKSKLVVQIQCALKLDGDFEMDGKLLFLEMKRKGKIHVFIRNIVNTITLNYIIEEGKDGKEYFRIKNFDHTYELKEKSDVSFGSSTQDSDVLSQATEDVIKSSGNEIILEIGKDVIEAALKKVVETINNLFEKYPINELTLD